jgi:membrane fusion protein, multidrug efflux system
MNRVRLGNCRWTAAAIALAAVVAAGCRQAAVKPPPAPPTVTVMRPAEHEVVRWDQFSAYLSSPETSVVKARVSGLIEKAPFREGALVHKGDLLFKIDPRPFQADVDNKRAAAAQARATADQARLTYARDAALLRAKVLSAQDYDNARAAYEESVAALRAAQAALETARLNLEWTDVRAPITGRISKMDVTVGNLVSGGSAQATTLTTIVSIDPIYCYLNVPETDALLYQEIAWREHQANIAGARLPCLMHLENETGFPRRGAIDFVDNQVDVSTGTVQMRCVFANPTALLMPGLTVVARVPASARYRALLIPDQAVNTDQNERYLLVVGAGDIVERRAVKLGALFGDLRAIAGGLKANERVIVNGMQLATPGKKVVPREAPFPAATIARLDAETALATGAMRTARETASPEPPQPPQ